MSRPLIDILLSVVVLVLQTTIVRFLSIQGIVPDLVLLWVIMIAIRRGQIPATIAGFLLGLALDLISGPEGVLGLTALTETVGGFLAGYFYNENKILQTMGGYQILLITALISLIHNVLYFLVFLQGSGLGWLSMLVSYGIPTTVYTTAIAILPMFAYARKILT
jgi:rod shape-determining protein MreD